MTYVTSIQTSRQGWRLPLAEICGPLPDEIELRVRGLSVEQLQQLGKDLLRLQSLADLENWLARRSPAPE